MAKVLMTKFYYYFNLSYLGHEKGKFMRRKDK